MTRATSASDRLRGHVAAAAGFAVLSILWTWPVAADLSTSLPGSGYGDNITFLWNFWWMRQAVGSDAEFFRSAAIFAPFGVDLTLHTHSALPAFLGATVLRPLPLVAALNLTLIASVFLAGLCAYALALRLTGDRGAAAIAGVIFGSSPFMAAHLQGHFNVTGTWVLPLFALAASEMVGRGSIRWGVVAGLVLGATAYVDYYFVVFEAVLALAFVLLEARVWTVWRREAGRGRRRLAHVVAALILADLLLLAAIATTGGFQLAVFGVRISARNWFNPLQALWLLAAIWCWLRLRLQVAAVPNPAFGARRTGIAISCCALAFVLSAGPVLWNAARLVARGDYVTQRHFWRSGPAGVDLSALVLGHPFHGLWGSATRQLFESRGIDAIESSGWIGLAAAFLTFHAIRHRWAVRAVRRWTVVGGAFLLWALGPHLMLFGLNTGMILPQAILRYLPILSNARIPGRAMVVVYLSLAVLSAIALADWRRRSPRPALVLAGVMAVVLLDYMPAPLPTVPMQVPAIYETLLARPERGAVLELPLGLRDGFGVRGNLDHRVLFYQTVHERPVAGGFVARLPRPVVAAYHADPLLSALLRLSSDSETVERGDLPGRRAAADLLAAHGISFVVVNGMTAPARLIEYVERVMPVTQVAEEGDRRLYLVGRMPRADR